MRRSRLCSTVLLTGVAVVGSAVMPATAWAGKSKASVDRTAPTVSIGSPTAGSTDANPLTVTGASFDNVAVSKVMVAVDSGTSTNASGTSTWSWSAPALGAGAHTVRATAYDTSGNATSASVTFSVSAAPDTTAPTVAISAPSPSSTVAGAFQVTGTASDNTSVSSVQVKVDNGSPVMASGTMSWSAGLDSTTWASGNHTITAQAVDGAGNLQSTSVVVTVATPSTTTASGPDITLNDPSATNGLALLGRGRGASWGTVSVVLYWEEFTSRRAAFFRDSSTGATSYVSLPVDNQTGWARAAYAMTSAKDLWVFGGSGPMELRHYLLTDGTVPTGATLVTSQVFGDSDSRQGDFIRLASGGLLASWMQQGATGPQGQWLAYQAPGASSIQVTGPLQFVRTKASKSVLVQHPTDGSIWLFSDPDAWGAIAVAHLSESGGSLNVDWTDAQWLNTTTYGDMGPDPENPDLSALADPSTGTVVLAYQGAHRAVFQNGTTSAVGSYPVVARIPATGTPSFTQLPTYVERISSMGLTLQGGDVRLAYRPVDAATATFDRLSVSQLHAGSWGIATDYGQMYSSWEILNFSPTTTDVGVRMANGTLHLFTT
jgi:hypothetical protein